MANPSLLTKYTSQVVIVHRRDEFRASAAMQKKVFDNEKIKVRWNTEVREFVGQRKLEKIKLFNSKENKDYEEEFDGAFVAIGHIPATDIFSGKIELDEKGYVVKKKSQSNIREGVFVAGDVHDYTYRQAITAAGYGCMAGMDTLRYLDKEAPNW